MEWINRKTLKYVGEDGVDTWNTGNVFIEGGNLEALKLLCRGYRERIGLIYIDPPYNMGARLMHGEGFVMECGSAEEHPGKYGTADKRMRCSVHEDWRKMMYPGLKIARELLSENGVIFISIDDNEQAKLRIICDEIFGRYNFLAQIIWEKPYGRASSGRFFSVCHEYILCYARNRDDIKCSDLSGSTVSGIRHAGDALSTLWRCRETNSFHGTAKKLKELFESRSEFLKPVSLIKQCVQLFTDDDSLVLDFFSDSAVTAHAIMELNAQMNGNRKCILIDSSQNSISYGTGSGPVKEHLRLIGETVKQKYPDVWVDTAFRVFRVADVECDKVMDADSNSCMYRKDDAETVFALMLMEYGIPLSETLEPLPGIGNRTYLYAGKYLVCLETEAVESLINKISVLEPFPEKLIFRDSVVTDAGLKDWIIEKLGVSSAEGTGTGLDLHAVAFI